MGDDLEHRVGQRTLAREVILHSTHQRPDAAVARVVGSALRAPLRVDRRMFEHVLAHLGPLGDHRDPHALEQRRGSDA